jgi:hypothetical protein
MSDSVPSTAMHQQLLEMSAAAFTRKHYQVAYHLLCAAMYAAIDLGSDTHLAAVEQILNEQYAEVLVDDSADPLSEEGREHRGILNSYAAQRAQLATRRRLMGMQRKGQSI